MQIRSLGLLISFVFILGSCAGIEKRMEQQNNKNQGDKPQDGVEVSLKQDRSELKELRKDIPIQKQRENDELAYLLNMLREDREINTSSVRQRFNRELRKRRNIYKKVMKKRRDEFTKNQKRAREEFVAKQKSERTSFNRSTKDREDRAQFFSEQDQERRTFFGDQRDRSSAFRDETNQRQRNFNDEIREKQKEFNQLIRDYDRRQRERRKALRTEKNMKRKESRIYKNAYSKGLSSDDVKAIQDFNKIPPGPGIYLGVPRKGQ